MTFNYKNPEHFLKTLPELQSFVENNQYQKHTKSYKKKLLKYFKNYLDTIGDNQMFQPEIQFLIKSLNETQPNAFLKKYIEDFISLKCDTGTNIPLYQVQFFEQLGELYPHVNKIFLEAGEHGNYPVLQYLLNQKNNGLNINTENPFGKTVLSIVSGLVTSKYNQETFQLLLEKGANPNIGGGTGHDPVYFAIRKKEPRMIYLLLKYGADIYQRSPVYQAEHYFQMATRLGAAGVLEKAIHIYEDEKGIQKVIADKQEQLASNKSSVTKPFKPL